jgi:hypothetical protein
MKHATLRSIAHDAADSLASGICLMIGHFDVDVFAEADRLPGRTIAVDFRGGTVVEGEPSKGLRAAVAKYREAVAALCARQGGSLEEVTAMTVRFWSDALGPRFRVTVEDCAGRRSSTDYRGRPGKRVRIRDGLGRLRPRPSRRETGSA